MARFGWLSLCCVAAVALSQLSNTPAWPQESNTSTGNAVSNSSELVVWCYDATRDVVTRELSSRCHGSVVSDTEATKIQNRRASEIIKALSAPLPSVAGSRLASTGTAFFVDDDGHLITNHHVVDGCETVTIDRPGGKSFPARVQAIDDFHDLALLDTQIQTALLGKQTQSPTPAKFRSQDLTENGAFVAAIGYPEQGLPLREPVVTTGVLLAMPASQSWGERLAIKGDIRHGNSGSPIVDQYGLVVGVVDAKIDAVKTYRETGVLPPDIGIGVSLPTVLRFLQTNGIQYQYAHNGPVLTAAQILAAAQPYIARINCWK